MVSTRLRTLRLLLGRPRRQWTHTANVEFAAAAPYAALLIVVSGLPVYLLTTRM